MAKQNIGPRISDKSRDCLTDTFQTLNGGASYVLESFPALYRGALIELKGRFSRSELLLMVDCMNATMITPGLCDEVRANAVDGMALDGLDEKWEVNRADLSAKLQGLTSFQTAALTIWTNGFWYGGGDERPERDLDEYAKALL